MNVWGVGCSSSEGGLVAEGAGLMQVGVVHDAIVLTITPRVTLMKRVAYRVRLGGSGFATNGPALGHYEDITCFTY